MTGERQAEELIRPMARRLAGPVPFRILNFLGEPFKRSLVKLDVARFRRTVEKRTGLSEWGSEDFWDRFGEIAQSLQNGPLNTLGRVGVRFYWRTRLEARQRSLALLERHPEIRNIPIERPIIVTGWYRTGTTFLHNLFGGLSANRTPKTWELTFPAPILDEDEADVALRKARTSTFFKYSKWLIPEQSAAHHVGTETTEECFFLLELDAVSTTLFHAWYGFDYARGLLDQDLRSSYEFLREQYQILSWQGQRDRRWVLKCPYHLWNLDSLLEVFPDACVVQTHRDPVRALASCCSLSAITSSKFVTGFDPHDLGRFWLEHFRVGMERAQRARERLEPGRVLDLDLSDLSADPVGTIEHVYRHFGLELPSCYADEAASHLADNPRNRHGKHNYTLEEFGLTPDEVMEVLGGFTNPRTDSKPASRSIEDRPLHPRG